MSNELPTDKNFKVEIKNGKAVEFNHYTKPLQPTLRHFYQGTQKQYDNDRNKKFYDYCSELTKWQQAEAARKVYEIEPANYKKCKCMITSDEYKKNNCVFPFCLHNGSIHEAELINETTVKII